MLVLSRKVGETIVIGDNIELTVVEVTNETVRLGINAPREIAVHRKEVYEEIQAENLRASQNLGSLQNNIGQLKNLPRLPKKQKKTVPVIKEDT